MGCETKEMSGEEWQVCELWIPVCSHAALGWQRCDDNLSVGITQVVFKPPAWCCFKV